MDNEWSATGPDNSSLTITYHQSQSAVQSMHPAEVHCWSRSCYRHLCWVVEVMMLRGLRLVLRDARRGLY